MDQTEYPAALSPILCTELTGLSGTSPGPHGQHNAFYHFCWRSRTRFRPSWILLCMSMRFSVVHRSARHPHTPFEHGCWVGPATSASHHLQEDDTRELARGPLGRRLQKRGRRFMRLGRNASGQEVCHLLDLAVRIHQGRRAQHLCLRIAGRLLVREQSAHAEARVARGCKGARHAQTGYGVARRRWIIGVRASLH